MTQLEVISTACPIATTASVAGKYDLNRFIVTKDSLKYSIIKGNSIHVDFSYGLINEYNEIVTDSMLNYYPCLEIFLESLLKNQYEIYVNIED